MQAQAAARSVEMRRICRSLSRDAAGQTRPGVALARAAASRASPPLLLV
jgi:hypothetical protein